MEPTHKDSSEEGRPPALNTLSIDFRVPIIKITPGPRDKTHNRSDPDTARLGPASARIEPPEKQDSLRRAMMSLEIQI